MSSDFKRHIENVLHLWEEGKFDAVIQDITSAALCNAGSDTWEADSKLLTATTHWYSMGSFALLYGT
jgi:hypothetical protein